MATTLKQVIQHSSNVSVYECPANVTDWEQIKRYGRLVATRFGGVWLNEGKRPATAEQAASYAAVVVA